MRLLLTHLKSHTKPPRHEDRNKLCAFVPLCEENEKLVATREARVLLLLLFIAPLLIAGCKPAPKTAPQLEPPPVVLPASVLELPPDDAERFLAATPDVQIIDVRTGDEWKEHGHLPKARLIDFFNEKAASEALAQLDKKKPAFVYCALGGRARHFAVEMARLGFSDVRLLRGGLNAWITARKPVER